MKRKDEIVIRSIGGASVLVPTGTRVLDLNCLVVLNETGRCVWELLDGNRSLEDITSVLVDRFEVMPGQARTDACAFIKELEQMGMLEHDQRSC